MRGAEAIRKLAKTPPKENWVSWLQSPQTDKLSQAAEGKAWNAFLEKYPNADKSKSVAQTGFDDNRKATVEIYYKEGPGSSKSVFGSDSKYWPIEMRNALGFHKLFGFPLQLSLYPAVRKTIPAVNFDENIMSPDGGVGRSSIRIGETLNKAQKIYITPTDFFTAQYRQIFKDTQITFRTSKNARKWLGGPHMGFCPQQLNFALWCATTGCRISREILAGGLLAGNLQVRAFYLFHVYFTTRRILFEMDGFQRISTLPDDPNFSQTDNKYDEVSYRKLCCEFGVNLTADFRFNHGQNHGLGCFRPL